MDEEDFGCSYLAPDGVRCMLGETELDTQESPRLAGEKPCVPDDCPLIGDLMSGGDLFSG